MNFVIEERPYDDQDVASMVAEVQAEYVELYGGPDESAVDLTDFVAPTGLFLVGLLDGIPVATGGWRRMDAVTAEIKRMYVTAANRRRGLAWRMLAELENTAAAAGIARLVLFTGAEQPAAIAMYERAGYLGAPGFGFYVDAPNARFYRKRLTRVQIGPAASR